MIPIIRPTYKQHLAFEKLLDNETKFLLFGGGAGGGKTWLGCEWLITNCYRYPGYKAFIGRKELKGIIGSTFETFVKVCQFHGIPKRDWKYNKLYSYLQFANGSRIDLLALSKEPSDPYYQRLGSLEYTDGWIEEAEEVAFEAFDILKTRIGRWKNDEFKSIGKILLTANPSKGWLYRTFYKPWKSREIAAPYAFVQSLYKDNHPEVAAIYGKQLQEIKDQATRERLMLGNWEYDDDPTTLIKYDAIIDLFTNTVDKEGEFLTADIARFGSAKTVIGIWNGLDLVRVITKQKQGLDRTTDMIRTLLRDERIPYSRCMIDEDGIGGAVLDSLQGVRGFVANSAPIDIIGVTGREIERPNFRNLKAQCSYALAEAVNERKLAISAKLSEEEKTAIIEELEQVKSKFPDKDRSLQVRTKEEVIEALGRSPDYSDMMMQRFSFEFSQPQEASIVKPARIPYGTTRFG